MSNKIHSYQILSQNIFYFFVSPFLNLLNVRLLVFRPAPVQYLRLTPIMWVFKMRHS